MGSGFGSNIPSLTVQRHLAIASANVSESFQRLSSGLRINGASDDAAGLSIATTLNTQSRLQGRALQNINDGVSMLNIVDGTLSSQTSILDRLSELAEQAANGTFSSKQRLALNSEYQALLAEFGRLGETTTFNGLQLLSADLNNPQDINLQIGINGRPTSIISASTANTSRLSGVIDTYNPTHLGAYADSGTFDEISDHFLNNVFYTQVVDNTGRKRDVMIGVLGGNIPGASNSIDFITYQRVSDTGGVGASAGSGTVTDANDEWVWSGSLGYILRDDTGIVPDSTTISANFTFQGGATATLSLDISGLQFSDSSYLTTDQLHDFGPTTSIDVTGVENQSRALSALTIVGRKLQVLDQLRSQYGALQSRLSYAAKVADVSRENLTAAASRITDIDVASESANLIASQIKQQAATSVLAQANQQPSIFLSLLSDL